MFKGIYGYRRMTGLLRKLNGYKINRKRVRRIMRALGIKSFIRQKKANRNRVAPECTKENILNRDFYASKTNEKWCTDVTEFKINNNSGKLYLNLYDLSIVSFKISRRNDNKIVIDTFDLAMNDNHGATPILNSDQGFQYSSRIFKSKLELMNMRQSMSRVGKCIDNAPIENFWGILKTEMKDYKKIENLSELEQAIIDQIKFYNEDRIQERFNFLTPSEVRSESILAESLNEEVKKYPIPHNKKIADYKANYCLE